MTGLHRERVADFWDAVLAEWLAGEDALEPPLDRWCAAYKGKGHGAVDLEHYPDPYVGDLRGVRAEPRLVVLGLNPGVGYPDLQSREGLWAQRIKALSYSRCFERSPAEDPKTWVARHGKESRYWSNLARFARRWLDDVDAGAQDILNFELYPWHSKSVKGKMRPPADLIDEYVWKPVGELDVEHVFAFGAEWFRVCNELGLEQHALFGVGGLPFPGGYAGKWRLGLFGLPSGQVAVVSAQSGYAGPPGPERLELMRQLVS